MQFFYNGCLEMKVKEGGENKKINGNCTAQNKNHCNLLIHVHMSLPSVKSL